MSSFPKGSFVSTTTGAVFPLHEPRWCGDDGELLDLEFDAVFDPRRVESRAADIWRYREALPLPDTAERVSCGEPMTPLVTLEVAGLEVATKLDYLFPSGSYKDRGSAVLISFLKAQGVTSVVQDSSGNAAASIAQYCARGGISCRIYVPERASPAKIRQIVAYGAEVERVSGTREETAGAALAAAGQTFYASHVWHPCYFHGTKTFAYEICEQLGWRAPDTLILPVSNGALFLGSYLGLRDLVRAGIIGDMPRLVAVQTETCPPIYNAHRDDLATVERCEPRLTIAEGIAANFPARGSQILGYLRNTGGTCLAVSEDEIKSTLVELCSQGFYVEPTAAVAIAGVKQYVREYARKGETIVSTLTGSGLKAPEQIAAIVNG